MGMISRLARLLAFIPCLILVWALWAVIILFFSLAAIGPIVWPQGFEGWAGFVVNTGFKLVLVAIGISGLWLAIKEIPELVSVSGLYWGEATRR